MLYIQHLKNEEMEKINMHPTVINYKKNKKNSILENEVLNSKELKEVMLELGADDLGFVELSRTSISDQTSDIVAAYPKAKTLISYVCKMNKEPIRTPARSVANLEFHHTGDKINEVGNKIVRYLEDRGVGGINPAMGFPMEMDNYPEKMWVVSHKPVAEAAGLGKMGLHRNLIHHKFGNFILLGTIIIEAEVDKYDFPIDYNPCLGCNLCAAACPVGAISLDGNFNFSSCYNHNYREFMGGFTDWVEHIADSKNGTDYRKKVNSKETASMWQSLSFGANYKAAYCLSVCPAGEDIIGTFLENKKEHVQSIVKPLQNKLEPIYVVPNSDAEDHVKKYFPKKTVRNIRGTLRSETIASFLKSMHLVFQRNQSEGLNAVYHFIFDGKEKRNATITIKNKKLVVEEELIGKADLVVRADSEVWIKVLKKEMNIFKAIFLRKIKLKGAPKLLRSFEKCFPS